MALPQQLAEVAESNNLNPASLDFAKALDAQDSLASLRSHYHLPLKISAQKSAWPHDKTAPEFPSSEPAIYLCGNSLGPLPKRTRQYIAEELDAWATHGVLGHFNHPRGPTRQWTRMEEVPTRIASDIVGAKPAEVTICNTLTCNLHTALATFYRPLAVPQSLVGPLHSKRRHKIIHERGPFPSDRYALASTVQLNGGSLDESLVPLAPRDGEDTLRTEDILAVLEREAAGGECWGILLGSVQYFTGQSFELDKIAKRAQELGVLVAYDLAHAFANVPLALHDWGVDFAVWCTYKYGSSGPGGIGGLFVHEKWHKHHLVRPAGWWGHNKATRFAMPEVFDPLQGAAGWQVSNPSFFELASLRASLETLAMALELSPEAKAEAPSYATEEWEQKRQKQSTVGFGTLMPVLRAKSEKLTGYLQHIIFDVAENKAVFDRIGVKLVTPSDPSHRGSQLTLRVPNTQANSTQTDAPGPKTTSTTAASSRGSIPPPTSKETSVAKLYTYAEQKYGLIADIRNPDVIRLAPVAQYSTFEDVWNAVTALRESIKAVLL